MKRFLAISAKMVLVVMLSIFVISACDREAAGSIYVLDRDTSYALGMFMSSFMTSQLGLPILQYDYNAFRDGFKAFNEANETRFSMDEAMDLIMILIEQIDAQENEDLWAQGQQNIIDGAIFLEENGMRPEVITTASGLQYEVLFQGDGARPGPEDNVRVHYEGYLLDGYVFDSSHWYGEPIEFNLSWVISGWSEGLQLMSVGSTYRLYIPFDLAYGSEGGGPIPPFSTLIFDVELLDITE